MAIHHIISLLISEILFYLIKRKEEQIIQKLKNLQLFFYFMKNIIIYSKNLFFHINFILHL
jgi:hypothetical protein